MIVRKVFLFPFTRYLIQYCVLHVVRSAERLMTRLEGKGKDLDERGRNKRINTQTKKKLLAGEQKKSRSQAPIIVRVAA